MQPTADFAKDSVHSVQSWYDSGYCAVVTWGDWVRLFRISDRAFVRDIYTKKNSGGISVAMSSGDNFLFLGTYYGWGLACFDVHTGEIVWKRDDLQRFYGLAYSPSMDALFGYFLGKRALRIDPRTGATVESFRGVKDIAASPLTDLVLFGNRKSFILRNAAGENLWAVPRESFAVLDVAWSSDTVAISEAAHFRPKDGVTEPGILRCYGWNGELLWRCESQEAHVCPLMWSGKRRDYVGVRFSGSKRGKSFLLHWGEQTGRKASEREVPDTMCDAICQQGSTRFLVDYKTYECFLESIS